MRSGKRKIPLNSNFIFWYFGDFSHKRNIYATCVTMMIQRIMQTDS